MDPTMDPPPSQTPKGNFITFDQLIYSQVKKETKRRFWTKIIWNLTLYSLKLLCQHIKLSSFNWNCLLNKFLPQISTCLCKRGSLYVPLSISLFLFLFFFLFFFLSLSLSLYLSLSLSLPPTVSLSGQCTIYTYNNRLEPYRRHNATLFFFYFHQASGNTVTKPRESRGGGGRLASISLRASGNN